MDGIIFDVDGTLWDSRESVAQAWNQAVAGHTDFTVHLTADDLTALFGKTMDVIINQLFPQLGPEEQARLSKRCFENEHVVLKQKPGILYPGVFETLKTLAERAPLYIVSNCQQGYIEVLTETCGLTPFVSGHLCFGDTGLPKSGTLRLLMKERNLSDVVYVGDTQGDADACAEADVPFIYAAYGFGSVPSAKRTIRAIGELPALLGLA